MLATGTAVPAGVSAVPGPLRPTVVPGATDVVMPAARRRRPLYLLLGALLAVLLVVGGIYLMRTFAKGNDGTEGEPQTNPFAGIDFGTYRALVIGNSRYQYQPALDSAARDAREVAHLLETRYGFEVRLMQDAERNEIVTALADLAATATDQDNLLVYFAGHGQLLGTERAGNWLPVDAQVNDTSQWVSTRYDVMDQLAPSFARHVLVIADSCFSGSLAGPAAPTVGETEPARGPPSRDEVLQALRQRSRLVLTSGELSPVADTGSDGHSIFSGALLEVLRANREVLTAETIFARLTPRVVEASERLGAPQRPRFGAMEGNVRADGGFFFVPAQVSETTPGA